MQAESAPDAQKPKMEKEKSLALAEEGRELSSKNVANELNSMSSNNKEVRVVNPKDSKFLVD